MWKSKLTIIINCVVTGTIATSIAWFFLREFGGYLDPNQPISLPSCRKPNSFVKEPCTTNPLHYINYTCPPVHEMSPLQQLEFNEWGSLAVAFGCLTVTLVVVIGIHDIGLLTLQNDIEIWTLMEVVNRVTLLGLLSSAVKKWFNGGFVQCLLIFFAATIAVVLDFSFFPVVAIFNSIKHPIAMTYFNIVIILYFCILYSIVVIYYSIAYYFAFKKFDFEKEINFQCICHCEYLST